MVSVVERHGVSVNQQQVQVDRSIVGGARVAIAQKWPDVGVRERSASARRALPAVASDPFAGVVEIPTRIGLALDVPCRAIADM